MTTTYTLYLNSANTTGNTPNNNTIITTKSTTSNITYQVDYDALFRDNVYDEYFLTSSFISEPVANTATSMTGVLTLGLANPNRSNLTSIVLGHLQPIPNPNNYIPLPQYFQAGTISGTYTAGSASTPTILSSVTILTPNPWAIGDFLLVGGIYYPIVGGSTTTWYIGNAPVLSTGVSYQVYKKITETVDDTAPTHIYTFDTTGTLPEQIPRQSGKQSLTVRAQNYKQDTNLTIGEYSLKLVFECRNTRNK